LTPACVHRRCDCGDRRGRVRTARVDRVLVGEQPIGRLEYRIRGRTRARDGRRSVGRGRDRDAPVFTVTPTLREAGASER
jgi:hypothetical protein